jgi:alpha-mannosidase/mannosylglycerate hydrolase
LEGILAALGDLDTRLYVAITSSRSVVTVALAIGLAAINIVGAIWWLFGLAALRMRGIGRRGLAIVLTIALGIVPAWLVAELLKPVFQRPRPFLVVPGVDVLISRPTSFSFPSGDTAAAFGAAVALGYALPRLRWPAILIATGIALARVATGVHYPGDILGGALVGIPFGIVAPLAAAEIFRRLPWTIYVVPHTHWDREWYSRFEVYRDRLVLMVGKLLDLMERDERFGTFTFDGHAIWAEDHLAVRPEDRPRIERLVRSDRLLVGPWYVLADYLLVSGESIVRNFQEGLRVSGELGRAMRVCYVADPFGHPAQMPQIVRGFGYRSYVFARGVGDEGEELGSEFQWEAPSGDRVVASHQVAHYDNALPLVGEGDEPPAALAARVRRVLPRLMRATVPYAQSDALLFMVGTDHTEPYERLPEAVAAIQAAQPSSVARIAGLEAFGAALPASPPGVLSGEMVAGKYRPILRGVNSTRVWIKQANVECERLLLERCEPLDALAGGIARDRIRSLWRTLLENHPHDSICGCGIDDVHDLDMPPRFDRVRREGSEIAAELAARLAGEGDRTVVWSALPWERESVVDLGGTPTLVRCAGLGVAPARRADAERVRSPEDGVLENGRLRVEVAGDGTFALVDLASGARWARLNVLVDDGDRGDEYTYSYAGPTVERAALAGRRSTAVAGDRGIVTVETAVRVPAGLRPDRFARAAETIDCAATFRISLDSGADRVDVALDIDDQARDHRLRVEFDTRTRTLTHHAGAAFALLERPNRVPPRPGWVEPPTMERCVHDIVAVKGPTAGLAIGVDGIRDYAVLRDGATIAVTLLRCVGWLSRGDLRERRGHAGPALETPSAQCIGPQRFRYTVVPLDADRSLGAAIRGVREFLSPPWAARGDGVARCFLATTTDPSDAAAHVSAVRSGPDGRTVLRIASLSNEPVAMSIRAHRPIRAASAVDLREGWGDPGHTGLEVIRTAAPFEILADGSVVAKLAPYEIGTWMVSL